ncbi:MAG TPA: cytochrome b/b6 domain-containing protein [Telluria sp.]|jgi:cytochrome b
MDAMKKVQVWDLPTRLFHWLLALAIPSAIATGMIGAELIVWHGRLGLFILGLLAFRLVWGFIGPANARFARFVRGPAAIRAYLRGEWKGIGHNPLGALSVLAMLGLIALQVGSGLFADDDIAFRGPLADVLSDDWSSRLTSLHSLAQYGLIGAVVLHAIAIIYYVRVRRDNLLRPMVVGYKQIPSDAPDVASFNPARIALAFALAAAIAGAVVYAAAGGLHPAPAPVQAAPAW